MLAKNIPPNNSSHMFALHVTPRDQLRITGIKYIKSKQRSHASTCEQSLEGIKMRFFFGSKDAEMCLCGI